MFNSLAAFIFMMITHHVLAHSRIRGNPFFAHAFTPPASHARSSNSKYQYHPVTSPATNVEGPPARFISKHIHSRRSSSSSNAVVILKASPSGIDEWSQLAQAGVFFGSYLALGLATYPTTKLLDSLAKSVGLERWRSNVVESTLPTLLGLLYLTAGAGHFVDANAFRDIYPPVGTWGVWYVPGSAVFHVAWTGAVEVLGGAGLLFGGLRGILASGLEEGDDDDDGFLMNLILPASALALFVLTVLVTPANIYMFTHGAVMGDDMPPLDTSFHAVRFAVQVALLSLLLALAKDSFFFAWGDELD